MISKYFRVTFMADEPVGGPSPPPDDPRYSKVEVDALVDRILKRTAAISGRSATIEAYKKLTPAQKQAVRGLRALSEGIAHDVKTFPQPKD